MEVREKYIARIMTEPAAHGFTEIKFVHTPQICIGKWVRLRCQYVCRQRRQSDLCPPFSVTAEDTSRMLEEYRFGLFVRREIAMPAERPMADHWLEFQQSLVDAESEAFVRGYGKAFAIAAGNCLFGHLDDTMRPCDFSFKSRPTLEAVGINVQDTLDMIGWDMLQVREPHEPFQIYGLLLLE